MEVRADVDPLMFVDLSDRAPFPLDDGIRLENQSWQIRHDRAKAEPIQLGIVERQTCALPRDHLADLSSDRPLQALRVALGVQYVRHFKENLLVQFGLVRHRCSQQWNPRSFCRHGAWK